MNNHQNQASTPDAVPTAAPKETFKAPFTPAPPQDPQTKIAPAATPPVKPS